MTSMLKKIFGQLENKDDFDSLQIKIASPEEILSWSHGEVKEPETVNYNSFKPETGGLFCQQIFGPAKDYECACGKYKRIKYKGTVCERCGVEVGQSSVRRERMGHIKLAVPVSHTWFLREGKISTLLNIPQKKLEQVIYYDAYIVTEPGLTNLKLYDVISEDTYQSAIEEFGEDSFKVEIGAEGIRNIISKIDMIDEKTRLRTEIKETKSEIKIKALTKQLKLVESFVESKTNPAWMLPDIIPVIPPDMRPMVQLEAGSIATSDLNDLYRRVIIRNNRLKRFIDMNAPEIIVINEKRMLQEAVDSLFDNSKKTNPMVSQNQRPLKSLSDSLRGKTGRFRTNMLGKRVDYSGRSVIVTGPTLKLHQVGLPKIMALELFKPFVFSKLLSENHANTLRTARKMVINQEDIVWEVLEKVIHQHPVLLNRAPTLHRLSILAFEPVLVEGNAIRLHPLVCKGFNADFDGDTMAVHVPISLEAQIEARTLMLSTNNILSPANGDPIIEPTQDIVLGIYYMTLIDGEHTEKSPKFLSFDEIELALEYKTIKLHTPIIARFRDKTYKTTAGRMKLGKILADNTNISFDLVNKVMGKSEIGKLISETYEHCGEKTTVILADVLKNIGFEQSTKSGISIGFDDIIIPKEKKELLSEAEKFIEEIEKQYDNGLLSKEEKHNKIVSVWTETVNTISDLSYSALGKTEGDNWNSLYMMALSKARGNKTQMQQIGAMRGLVTKPDGSLIEIPIKSNFKEGLTMAEYFISTHGSRKGLADTALKTADAGYLTRRLVGLVHNASITEYDCKSEDFITVKPVYNENKLSVNIGSLVLGRTIAQDVFHPITKEIIVKKDELITKSIAKKLDEANLPSVNVRSVLTCCADGLCAKCYGMDLSKGTLVNIGEPVGIIAGQSVGEPGTQLTLRTFHSGGIASGNIDSYFIESPVSGKVKLISVSTIRNSKGQDIVISRSGKIVIINDKKEELFTKDLPYGSVLLVKDGESIETQSKIAEWDPYSNIIIAERDGIIKFNDLIENVSYSEEVNESTGIISRKVINWKTLTNKSLKPTITLVDKDGKIIELGGKKLSEYMLPTFTILNVLEGDFVKAGDVIAKIPTKAKRSSDITGGLPRINELLEVRKPTNPAILAEIDGTIELEDYKNKILIRIEGENEEIVEYSVPKGKNILVNTGDYIKKADKIVDGNIFPQDILRILGKKAFTIFMVEQIQQVYRDQGVTINDKHIEILIREMIKKVEVQEPGDTSFVTGQIVDKIEFEEENEKISKEGGRLAEASQMLIGLTKASLKSRSFISNASFQQTTSVLVDAAIRGLEDKLLGVNENLVVGRLVPIGTGAYVRNIQQKVKIEEQNEKKESENQQLLEL